MQVGSATPGLSRWLTLLAIVVIATALTLMTLAGTFATSTGEVESLTPNVGGAIIHDDAGNVHPNSGVLSGKVANVH